MSERKGLKTKIRIWEQKGPERNIRNWEGRDQKER
jgi:hypothetical protein